MLPMEHMKRLRRLDNITQQQIADILGCTKNYISQLENNKFPLAEEFYERWIKAIHLLSSMKPKDRIEYIKKLKENLEEEVEKVDSKNNKNINKNQK